MPYVSILEFTKGEVHLLEYPASTPDVEEWLVDKQKFRLDDIHYLCTESLIIRAKPLEKDSFKLTLNL